MRRPFLLLVVASLMSACGGDDLASPVGNPSYSLTMFPTSGRISRGELGTATISVGRTDGFTGTLSFTAENVPTGVVVQFAPQSVDRTIASTTAVISVSQSAASGSTTLSFRATSSGVPDKVLTYALTVP